MRVLLLGARLSLRGSRTRVAVTGLALAFAVAFLLAVLGALPARQAKLDRLVARQPVSAGTIAAPGERPTEGAGLRMSGFFTTWRGHSVNGWYVEPAVGAVPLPPGVDHWPRPGELVVSPALAQALRGPHGDELAVRLPGSVAGEVGADGLSGPRELFAYAGVARFPAPYPGQEVVRFGHRAGRPDVPKELRVAAQLGAVGLLLPVLVLVATATRLSAAARDRRLAAVRLVGGTPRQVALIAAGEALLVGVIGSAIGLLVFWVLRPLAARLVPVEGGVFAGDLLPPVPQLAGVLVVVPLLSLAVAVVAMRRLVVDPLGVRRQGRRRGRAGWWRLSPLAAGLAMLTALWVRRQDLVGPDAVLLLAGGAATVIGLAVVAPAVSRAAGAALVRLPGTATRLAGRRLQADPSATARTLTGTVLVVFVATWLLAFIPILKDSQGSEARSQSEVLAGSTISLSLGSALGDGPRRALLGVPGVRQVATIGAASLVRPGTGSSDPAAAADTSTQVAVARCPELASLLKRDLPCGSGRAFGISGSVPGAYGASAVGRWSVLGPDGRESATVTLPPPTAALDLGPDPWALVQSDTVVDPSLLPAGATRALSSKLLITTDGTPGTTERIRNLLWSQGVYGAATLDEQLAQEERVVRGYERAARLGLVLAVLVGAVGLVLTSADSVRSRRRDLASLAAVGVPVRVLRRALVLEVVAPLLGCTGLALGCGAFASAAYLAADTYYRDHLGLPWGSWGGVAAFAVLVVVAVTSLTLPLARGAARPENLRTE